MENKVLYEAAKFYLENGNSSSKEMKLFLQSEENQFNVLDDDNSIEAIFSEKIKIDSNRRKIIVSEYFFEIYIKYDETRQKIDKKLVINIVKFEFSTNQLFKLVQDYQKRRKIECEIYINYKMNQLIYQNFEELNKNHYFNNFTSLEKCFAERIEKIQTQFIKTYDENNL